MPQTLILVISYILGSIPFGFITAHVVKGIDIRKFGSGNIGATNVARVVGKKWGFIVFLLDFLKGMLPIVVVFNLYPDYPSRIYIAMALAAVAGHNWSIFLFFKGSFLFSSISAILSLRLTVSLKLSDIVYHITCNS